MVYYFAANDRNASVALWASGLASRRHIELRYALTEVGNALRRVDRWRSEDQTVIPIASQETRAHAANSERTQSIVVDPEVLRLLRVRDYFQLLSNACRRFIGTAL
jgi:hypothetical protein